MYKLTGVSKVYQKGRRTVPAVRDLDLVIDDGEWLAVQGRTGHGKTTLLQLLGGLDRPSTGVRFIFQTFNLVPTLSAAENVEAALIPLGTGLAGRRRRVAAALDSVALGDRARHMPSELSGGQQQRVAIARALVKEPKVLLADEPTGNLDEATRDEIIDLLGRLWRDLGLTLVLVTHDTSVARRAQRVGVMSKGRLSIKLDVRRVPGPELTREPDRARPGPGRLNHTRITGPVNRPHVTRVRITEHLPAPQAGPGIMTDTTPAPTYWSLLEEITEYRGRLIHLANTIYALIDAEERERTGHGPAAGDPRGPAPDTDSAASEEAAGWLAPVIPLSSRR